MTDVERSAQVFINTYKGKDRASALLALSVLVIAFFEEYEKIGEMTDSANSILTALMSCAFKKGLKI